LGTRGQYAWGNALAPQFQVVSTGFYGVRGYPQSVVAGDDMVLGRFEYRLHLPRLFPVDVTPMTVPMIGDFKLRPNQPNGLPDWDLIIRVFADAGTTRYEAPNVAQFDEDVVGVGGGLELRMFNSLVLTADYGVALKATKGSDVSVGDGEFYLLGTVIF
jgi:hemolysin activation/secretion protein